MKRYLIFEFGRYYPEGGMNDLLIDCDTKKEIVSIIKNRNYEWGYLMQAYDTVNRKTVINIRSRGIYKRWPK